MTKFPLREHFGLKQLMFFAVTTVETAFYSSEDIRSMESSSVAQTSGTYVLTGEEQGVNQEFTFDACSDQDHRWPVGQRTKHKKGFVNRPSEEKNHYVQVHCLERARGAGNTTPETMFL